MAKTYDWAVLCETKIDASNIDFITHQHLQQYSPFWVGNKTNSGGVAILRFNQNLSISAHRQSNDGRLAAVTMNSGSFSFDLITCYAPVDESERPDFFLTTLIPFLEPCNHPIIMFGDWNVVCRPLDRSGGAESPNYRGASELRAVMSRFDLFDPGELPDPVFTWSQRVNTADPTKTIYRARLDRFLISSCFQTADPSVVPVTGFCFGINHHAPVHLRLGRLPDRKGPGIRLVPRPVLQSSSFHLKLSSQLKEIFSDSSHSSASTWLFAKRTTKKLALTFLRECRAKQSEIPAKRKEYCDLLTDFMSSPAPNLQELRKIVELADEVQQLTELEIQFMREKYKVEDILHKEATTARFFARGRPSKGRDCDVTVNAAGCQLLDLLEHSEYVASYAETLFSETASDSEAVDELLKFSTKSITPEERLRCESLCTPDILRSIIFKSKPSMSGEDGLNINFYKLYCDVPGFLETLCLIFNSALTEGHLPDYMNGSVIRQIPKDGKDEKKVENRRMISLLDNDFKLFSSFLGFLIAPILQRLIGEEQTGFVRGRSISHNALLAKLLHERHKHFKINLGALIFLDFEKAFDRVRHSFIMRVLAKFGFGPCFLRAVFAILRSHYGQVIVLGHLSRSFAWKSGVFQGDPLAALLFIICVETLADALRNDPAIQGIALSTSTDPLTPSDSVKILLTADDTTLLPANTLDLEIMLRKVDLFNRASNGRLNINKTFAISLLFDPLFQLRFPDFY